MRVAPGLVGATIAFKVWAYGGDEPVLVINNAEARDYGTGVEGVRSVEAKCPNGNAPTNFVIKRHVTNAWCNHAPCLAHKPSMEVPGGCDVGGDG